MFSEKSSNRKPNQKSRASAEPDFQHKESLDSLREQEYRLNIQISELEEILASHAKKEERYRRQKQEIVLPPLDDMIGELEQVHAFHPSTDQRHYRQKQEKIQPRLDELPLHPTREHRTMRSQSRFPKSLGDSLYFFVLLLIAFGLSYWIFWAGG